MLAQRMWWNLGTRMNDMPSDLIIFPVIGRLNSRRSSQGEELRASPQSLRVRAQTACPSAILPGASCFPLDSSRHHWAAGDVVDMGSESGSYLAGLLLHHLVALVTELLDRGILHALVQYELERPWGGEAGALGEEKGQV